MKRLPIFVETLIVLAAACTNEAPVSGNPKGESVWKSQFENAISKGKSKSLNADDQLTLLNYSYAGRINSKKELESVLLNMFDDNSIFAYNNIDDSVHFVRMADIKKDIKDVDNPDDYTDIRDIIKIGMSAVNLTWGYQGKKYHSLSIVSDKSGYIYDNIGMNVLYSDKISLRTKALCDTTATDDSLNLYEIPYTQSGVIRNSIRDVAEYNVSCTSTFNEDGIFYKKYMHHEAESEWPWSVQSSIQTLHGMINIDNYHEFSWLVACSNKGNIQITFGDYGFIITGECTHTIGDTITHRKL